MSWPPIEKAAEYPNILEARPNSRERLTWPEMAKRAEAALLAKRSSEAESALEEFREAKRRDRVLSGAHETLEAAREGRVHKLMVERGAELQDLLGLIYPPGAAPLEGPQDLINAAAAEPFVHRATYTSWNQAN